VCAFRDTGFGKFRPCKTAYHMTCVSVGAPFVSRRKGGAGLAFPKVVDWPNFVCEACTVREVLGRELTGPTDVQLLCLERMRLLDIAWYWSQGTHSTYQGKIRILRKFEAVYGASILRPARLRRPPGGPDIPLMWCQEAYSLRTSTRRADAGVGIRISWMAVRQLRSAASQYWAWDLLLSQPNRVMLTKERRLLIQDCRPTDGFSHTAHSTGMRARVGDEAKPSVALLDQHVRFLDAELDSAFIADPSPPVRREIALAGLSNALFWLGWFRTSEAFGLHWDSIRLLEPHRGPERDLPPGCGLLELFLNPETKSMRHARASVLIAYRTLSGFHPGKWLHRARVYSGLGRDWPTQPHLVFTHPDGTPWTSIYFRTRHLYPSLRRQQVAGDPYLRPFTGGTAGTIESKYWSLHCYRRGARSHVSRGGKFGRHRFRRATNPQVYEHARWRYRRSSEAVDVMYREWTPRDRIKLTLYCM
jgi:hypothetical protein